MDAAINAITTEEGDKLSANERNMGLQLAALQGAVYAGTVSNVTDHYVLQAIGVNDLVMHEKALIAQVPQVGQDLVIRYHDSVGNVEAAPLGQEQQQWATEIFPIASTLFNATRARHQEVEPGVFLLENNPSGNYALKLDRNQGQFSLLSRTGRGELARFGLNGAVQKANGLNIVDRDNWRTIRQTLQTFRQGEQNRNQDWER